jgi:hypothetical protein
MLQSLATGDILIGSGQEVRRYVLGAATTSPYYLHGSLPPAELRGLARSPFNELGNGGLIAMRDFDTLCQCGSTTLISADPIGTAPFPFGNESYPLSYSGMRAMAWGVRQDLYWLTELPVPGQPLGKTLFRIRQLPASGVQGSLLVSTGTASVTFDVYGPTPGNDPVVLGGVALPMTSNPTLLLAPYGIVDLFPLHPLYLPVLDGIGLFGPPNPAAATPPGGHLVATFPVPVGTGLTFFTQALIVSNRAPNGLFFVSNVAPLLLP